MKTALVLALLATLALAPTAAAWSVTTPDVFGGGCRSAEIDVLAPPGPYASLNGNCTATVGCDDLIYRYCE